ncbi:hypothetical protein K32_42330 [Kaistia sp. 32K]|nr:hypothetical protein K32_42330 [Kaistia sp. 32K]
MLLKGVLVQNREKVFEPKSGKSIGFLSALHVCRQKFGLTDAEAGTFRMINSLRDVEQHWIGFIEEDVLYLNTRATITAFDAYMRRALEIDLSSVIPSRVLPVSTMPPGNFDFLIDREFQLITQLLQPGNRKRDEARARIRTLLAMEGLAAEEIEISERDINRIERAVRAGVELGQIFPRLNTIASTIEGEGTAIVVRFAKKEGAPVQFIGGDDPQNAAAVREVDLQKKFYLSATGLAKKVKLTAPRSHALRMHLGIDADPACCRVFEFGKAKHPQFSDNAVARMKEALDGGIDMGAVWANRGQVAFAGEAATA